MKTHPAGLAWVAAVAIAGTLAFAWVAPLRAASPAEGQPAPGMMDHGAPGMMDHGAPGMMDHGAGMMDHGKSSDGDMRSMMQHHEQMMQMMARMQGAGMRAGAPTLPGQDAFGAIGEAVALLEADPTTDWSKIDLEALRQHLIDMNEVTLNAAAAPKQVDGGIQIAVTGTGRTLAAIQRMLPMHAAEIDGQKGWSAKTSTLADGVLLTVTATDPKEVAHIRGLGFAGIMVEGSHHQAHHLAIAKGEPMHAAGAEHAKHVQ
jgi:hypothetical protein